MLETESNSLLSREEILLCLVLQYLIEELAVLTEQYKLMGSPESINHFPIILP